MTTMPLQQKTDINEFDMDVTQVNALVERIPEKVKDVKWKLDCHQVVIQTPNYFYKIYEDPMTNVFGSIIRQKLANIYQNRGIDWQIERVEKNGLGYDVERREYLDVIPQESCSFDKIVYGVSNIFDELEESLELPEILKQLQEQDHRFTRVNHIRIWRESINKNIDYATKDGQIILLDDADWFLSFVDSQGNVIDDLTTGLFNVETSYGDFIITPLRHNFVDTEGEEALQKINQPQWQWFLRPADTINKNEIYQLVDKHKRMMCNNLKLRTMASNNLLIKEKKMKKHEEVSLYTNNTGRKTFQWELWQMCNSLCKFCISKRTSILKADLTMVEARRIKIGDEIIGFEGEGADLKPVKATVLNVSERHFKGKLYGEFFTENHPIMTLDYKSYIPAKDSRAQIRASITKNEDGTYGYHYDEVCEILEESEEEYNNVVYNFETTTGNYVANSLIVHNCYLGTDNRKTDKDRQLTSIRQCNEAIKNLDFTIYNNISLIGGEFFQGQIDDPDVHREFFDLMRQIGQLYVEKKIGSIWITVTLTLGDQHDLYDLMKMYEDMGVLPLPEYGASGVWLCTSWDTEGRFHNPQMKENWEYHMTNLKKTFPWLKFNTTLILTGPFCENYLSGEFNLKEFKKKFNCTVFFKQSGMGQLDFTPDMLTQSDEEYEAGWLKNKQDTNRKLGFEFFPNRKLFCEFLNKFAKIDRGDYERLFEIAFRSDELHRNFNDKYEDEKINRFKGEKLESDSSTEERQNKCGHIYNYTPYCDTNDCCICDRDTIFEATVGELEGY